MKKKGVWPAEDVVTLRPMLPPVSTFVCFFVALQHSFIPSYIFLALKMHF